MTNDQKITLLGNRLKKIQTRKKENDGVQRKIARELRHLKSAS